jgi:hypothetical protein
MLLQMVNVERFHAAEMVTLQSLKVALQSKTPSTTTSPRQALLNTQYSTSFDILVQGLINY